MGRWRKDLSVQSRSFQRPIEMQDSARPTVVVIDDNIATAMGLAELLELDGFSAHASFSGAGGLQQVLARRPEAVLLDMNMPEMNGVEVCRAIRAHPSICNTAIVILSGEHKLDDLGQADAFLTHPVPLDILAAVLHATIRKRSLLGNEPAPE